MTYDPGAQDAALLLRSIRGVAHFSGRSRRTEVGYYWIASSLVQALVTFIIATPLSWTGRAVVSDVVGLILALPYFALFARRLHDMNQSGWWALVLPLAILISLPHAIADLTQEGALASARHGITWLGWIGLMIMIALFAMTITPGTIGPNRFGADPREGGPDPSQGRPRKA